MAAHRDGGQGPCLAGLIERHFLRPFVWGECDCCLAGSNVYRDGGYPDPGAPFRGLYHDEAGARRIIGESPEGVIERRCREMGWPEISPDEATDWDAGIYAKTLLIRNENVWIGKSLTGAIVTRRARRAWRAVRSSA